MDEAQIADLVQRVASALDDRHWTEWTGAFTDDAVIDLSAAGIDPCSPADLQRILGAHDDVRIGSQHLLGRTLVDQNGDASARAHTEYRMLALTRVGTSLARRTEVAGWYDDVVTRAEDGWRIAERRAGMRWRFVDEIPWEEVADA